VLLAVACGATVANIYYAQPLLHVIADDLGVSPPTAVLIVTATQIGYALGLVLLVPLGDLLDRRRMVARMLLVTAVAMGAAAIAPNLLVLALALGVAAVTSVATQVLVALAGSLAADEERGRVVGVVMSGLLIGILLARTVSGVVAAIGGWRLVFWLAAGGMLVLAAALLRRLPGGRGPSTLPYGRLLLSVGELVRDEPRLRRRMFYGAWGMASFTTLWTSLALLLSQPPFRYGEATIGLFGLAGLAGAGAAQVAGHIADRGDAKVATGPFLGAVVLGWAALALGRHSVLLIVVGVVILDLGVQGQQILSQSVIYSLHPETRSRVTTAYMTTIFVFGALASAATGWAWRAGGWSAVCALGAGCAVIALAGWVQEIRPLTRSVHPRV
jgi:predicted MFS family arabinose efflux permease